MSVKSLIHTFTQQYNLPESFELTAEQYYLPLAQDLVTKSLLKDGVLFVGIHGCQGSGKSTLTDFLLYSFKHHFNVRSVGMSIDDFYLTKAERQQMAEAIHPLFITRGVPATHDTALLKNVMTSFNRGLYPISVPRFNKAIDDRESLEHWSVIHDAVEIVILEGWCVATPAQSEPELIKPVNPLERDEDPDSKWRRRVNSALEKNYHDIFSELNQLIMLKAPGFFAVKNWRLEQEQRLAASLAGNENDTSALMSELEIDRFIQHYQRLTEHSLNTIPAFANVVFDLNEARKIVAVSNMRKAR